MYSWMEDGDEAEDGGGGRRDLIEAQHDLTLIDFSYQIKKK